MAENTSINTDQKYNKLMNEKSPYLLQHARNPVDWYPWGEEAFEKARREDKPIFLSIGYSTCHWCHVMEHESFEDSAVAARMNELFVSIKVDREERPDIDNIYMSVCQMLTGAGGWPLTLIMTPAQKPFFAGTYLPKNSMGGRMGMLDLMERIEDYWNNKREEIDKSADSITIKLQNQAQAQPGKMLNKSVLREAFNQFAGSFDHTNGGFGRSPKFPTAHNLMFLLRYWKRSGDSQALNMVEKTLTEMRRGGMYDQIGFGFHRYSTDARWFLPHFEKMLYDQAMLAMTYIEAYQATGDELYKQTAREIFEYVRRDMTDSNGGFYSAEDADSEGEEGKFYLFSTANQQKILSKEELEFASTVFNMTATGNYAEEATGQKTGDNVLHLRNSYPALAEKLAMSEDDFIAGLKSVRQKIFEAREKRVHPHKDDKILTDWNGLMIAAFAMGGRVFDDPELTRTAESAMNFITSTMSRPDGLLVHRFRAGETAQSGFLDDYAFVVWGLLELYETTFDVKYLKQAITYNDYLIEHFWDDKSGGFYFSADNGEELIGRQKEIYDGAIPSGNSVAALNLIRLGRITANPDYEQRASQIGAAFSPTISQYPAGYAMLLNAVDFAAGPSYEIVVSGDPGSDDTRKMLTALNSRFIPNKIVVFRPDNETEPEIVNYAEYAREQTGKDNQATAYVCRNYACSLPTNDINEMLSLFKAD